MSKENENPNQFGLSSYKDVYSLGATKLNKICLDLGINTKFGKKAKINFVCLKLNLSTSGASGNRSRPILCVSPHLENNNLTKQEITEFHQLTPSYLVTLDGWTKDLKQVPDVDDGTIKKYLCKTNVITQSDSRRYKLCRPYQLKDFVHSMLFHPSPIKDSTSFVAIQAQCNPSQSSNAEDVKVVFLILDAISGQPIGGYCTCTVGFCQSCGHIGAVLFRVADLVASGFTSITEDQGSCTDRLCEWTDPKAAGIKPKLLDDIVVAKRPRICQRRTLKEYGSSVLGPVMPTQAHYQQILTLRDDLFKATQHLNQHVPAVYVLTPANLSGKSYTCPQPVCTLPEEVLENDQLLAPAHTVTVTTDPLPVAFYPGKLPPEDFVQSINYSENERRDIEQSTRDKTVT